MNHPAIVSIVLALCIVASNASDVNKVMIKNELGHNKVLSVHCKSKDDDLGYHYLRPGQKYDFSFRDNILLTTLFWCHLRQGPQWKHHQAFVVYKSSWNVWQGSTYKWIAREDGIYYTMDYRAPRKKFGWDVPIKGKKLIPKE